jgi:hypothetical protein
LEFNVIVYTNEKSDGHNPQQLPRTLTQRTGHGEFELEIEVEIAKLVSAAAAHLDTPEAHEAVVCAFDSSPLPNDLVDASTELS